jgi:hypothetical protein
VAADGGGGESEQLAEGGGAHRPVLEHRLADPVTGPGISGNSRPTGFDGTMGVVEEAGRGFHNSDVT